MANITEMQIGLDVFIGASSGIVGAVGAYIKLKSKLDLVEAKNESQEKEIEDLRERKKEMSVSMHKRIDNQNGIIVELQKEMSSGHNSLETAMARMELRIVKEIQKMVKEFTKC